MLLIYTIETDFYVGDDDSPVSLITVGISPHVWVQVNTTASAILTDVRSGYVYGAIEANADRKQQANHWTSKDAIDQSRRRTEREAFVALLEEFKGLWPKVVEERRKALARR